MKPKLKVWFEYWSPDMPIGEENFFLRVLKKKYDVELAFPADIVFFSNYSPPTYRGFLGRIYRLYLILLKKNRFGVPRIDWLAGSHKSVFVSEENVRPILDRADLSLAFDREEPFLDDGRYMRLPFYAMVHNEIFSTLIGIKRLDFVKKKHATKFCEFVYSKSVSHREKFFDALCHYKEVDSPGKSRNNMPPIGSSNSALDSRVEEDWIQQKIEFSSQYKFSIAIENCSQSGYTTEKIVNAYASGCIPIYYGDPTIAEDFNPDSFINLHDYVSFEEAIEKIKEIDQNEIKYRKMLEAPVFKNNEIPYAISEERVLSKLETLLGENL